MKLSKGFTLIELMVVIVIIGILSALAIPKMFGVSAKAKAAEAPGAIANWETLVSAYSQETGKDSTFAAIGFKNPTSNSKWIDYTQASGSVITATVRAPFGDCKTDDFWQSTHFPTPDSIAHTLPAGTTGKCKLYTPNF